MAPTLRLAAAAVLGRFMGQRLASVVLLVTVQKRPPEGGEPDQETVQWTVYPANARARLRGPGGGRGGVGHLGRVAKEGSA